jgi:hypothetical protein
MPWLLAKDHDQPDWLAQFAKKRKGHTKAEKFLFSLLLV